MFVFSDPAAMLYLVAGTLNLLFMYIMGEVSTVMLLTMGITMFIIAFLIACSTSGNCVTFTWILASIQVIGVLYNSYKLYLHYTKKSSPLSYRPTLPATLDE
jgi:hypothetical protein